MTQFGESKSPVTIRSYRRVFCTLTIALAIMLLRTLVYAQPYGRQQMFMPPSEPGLGWRLAVWATSAAVGALLGALCSEAARPFRRFLWWLLIGLAAVGAALTSSAMVTAEVFVAGFFVAYWLLRLPRAPRQRDITFGSAEWATLAHLREHELTGEQGFFLGTFAAGDDQPLPLHYKGDRHLLTVAPTRSGKGTSSIVPNLLTYEGSALVIDPKGENARITASRRGAGAAGILGMKQKVHVVDPWGITGMPVSRFNPLDWIASDEDDSSENAMMLADSIVTSRSNKTDPFWDEEAKALLMGFILFVAFDPAEEDRRTLGRVRDIIVSDADQLTEVLARMTVNPHPIVQTTAARTASKEEKLRMGVLASLQAHTHFLDSPAIRTNLSYSDFQFEELKTGKVTVYLVLPADRLETFGRWLRLLVQQAITVNARNIEHKPDKPILFLLDEMAALGRLTMVEQAYGLMAGFGMQLWGIVQDLSQLEKIYGKGWETFIGNSGVLQYFGSRDHKTAEYFSKLCGVTTMEKFSFSNSLARVFSSTSGSNNNSSSSSGQTFSDSYTRDVVQRHLAYADELMVLRDNRQLLFIENFNPIQACKLPWFADGRRRTLGLDLTKEVPSVAPMPESEAA